MFYLWIGFAIGQALGGYMRRHRASNMKGNNNIYNSNNTMSCSGGSSSLDSLQKMKTRNQRV